MSRPRLRVIQGDGGADPPSPDPRLWTFKVWDCGCVAYEANEENTTRPKTRDLFLVARAALIELWELQPEWCAAKLPSVDRLEEIRDAMLEADRAPACMRPLDADE